MKTINHLCRPFVLGTLLVFFSSGVASHSYLASRPTALGELNQTSCSIQWTRTASRSESFALQRMVRCHDSQLNSTRSFVQVLYEGQTLFTTLEELNFPFDLRMQIDQSPPEKLSQTVSKYLAEAPIREAERQKQAETDRARAEAETQASLLDEQAERQLAATQIRKRLNNAPIAILRFRPYDVSEYTDGTGIDIEVANLSKKPIKYLSFRYIGLNAVNDPVTDLRGSATRGFRGIGPIAPNETGAYKRDYAWLTDIVETVRIFKIDIEYMDGSKRVVSQFDRIQISDDEANLLGLSR